MKIVIGSDHRGFDLKSKLILQLSKKGHEIIDMGASDSVSVDYPVYASKVAEAVQNKTVDKAILICGSGHGV